MNVRAVAVVAAVGVLAVPALACDTCMKNMHIGKAEVLGNGLVWSWVKTDKAGKPISVGITMTETAMEGLPDVTKMPKGREPMMEINLGLPNVKGLPFDHVGFDWNPVGHPPVKIYDVPHFDVHFYTIGMKTRREMMPKTAGMRRAAKAPAAKFIPAGYMMPPDTVVPQMGAHWIAKSAKELRGNPFSTTFLYGTYNGQEAFYEPMVTTAFMQTKPDFKEAIPAPAAYARPGYYPTRYRVQYNAQRKEYTIALDGLTYRSGVGTMKVAKRQ